MATPIPKIVWMLWLQGWDSAPPLVQACRASWERLNPGWRINLLTEDDARHLPVFDNLRSRYPAALSDVVRAETLAAHGGVWADATLFCVSPLDRWLLDRSRAGFFAFESPGFGRMLSSWFLAAAPGNHLMAQWHALVRAYWRDRTEPDAYFWFHRLFADLYGSDPVARATWDGVQSIAAAGPHYFAPYQNRYTGPMSRRAEARLAARPDPVYKLSTKIVASEIEPGSAYSYFAAGAATDLRSSPAWEVFDRVVVDVGSWAKKSINTGRLLVPNAIR